MIYRAIRQMGLVCVLAASSAQAVVAQDSDGCEITIRHDVRVNLDRVSVSSAEEPLYDIGHGGLMTVRGEPVRLNKEQRALVEEYGGELAALVPQLIELAAAALRFAGDSLSSAFDEAFGAQSATGDRLALALAEASERFEARAKPEPGVYVLGKRDDDLGNELDEEIDNLVSAAMEEAVQGVGSLLFFGEGTFVERMRAFSEGMERVGHEVERSSAVVSDWSKEVCSSMERARALEAQVAQQVPEFSGLGVL